MDFCANSKIKRERLRTKNEVSMKVGTKIKFEVFIVVVIIIKEFGLSCDILQKMPLESFNLITECWLSVGNLSS